MKDHSHSRSAYRILKSWSLVTGNQLNDKARYLLVQNYQPVRLLVKQTRPAEAAFTVLKASNVSKLYPLHQSQNTEMVMRCFASVSCWLIWLPEGDLCRGGGAGSCSGGTPSCQCVSWVWFGRQPERPSLLLQLTSSHARSPKAGLPPTTTTADNFGHQMMPLA